MREKLTHEYPLPVVVDCDDQAVFVAADVEHGCRPLPFAAPHFNPIRAGIEPANVDQAPPLCALGILQPFDQARGRVGILSTKLPNPARFDDPHMYNYTLYRRAVKADITVCYILTRPSNPAISRKRRRTLPRRPRRRHHTRLRRNLLRCLRRPDFLLAITQVPEPATATLLAVGGMTLLARRRRRAIE